MYKYQLGVNVKQIFFEKLFDIIDQHLKIIVTVLLFCTLKKRYQYIKVSFRLLKELTKGVEMHQNQHTDEIELDQELLEMIGKHFDACQRSFQAHNNAISSLTEHFRERPQELVDHIAPFVLCLLCFFLFVSDSETRTRRIKKRVFDFESYLSKKKKKNTCVERVIAFVIGLAMFRDNGVEWKDVVVTGLLNYLIEKENAKNKAVRFRVCDIIAKLMKSLDEDYELEEAMWEKLQKVLTRRANDKIPQVRRAAISAMHRVQGKSCKNVVLHLRLEQQKIGCHFDWVNFFFNKRRLERTRETKKSKLFCNNDRPCI
ncbi:condensin complex component, non-smc subunit [Reticulomyxa filosa]|uniref:Condensin complex component, non-smc subunit n=1 Tax=Reticulomyxa filosa TaxID=46433 RepID=X6NB05_RETFI|nr:condensin complex component, non-smc subunit [Reticulomyxa filosa]|eukprot:ETO23460.1 condensin complex component, non-smc subunit [Reticulomyxa filosa]